MPKTATDIKNEYCKADLGARALVWLGSLTDPAKTEKVFGNIEQPCRDGVDSLTSAFLQNPADLQAIVEFFCDTNVQGGPSCLRDVKDYLIALKGKSVFFPLCFANTQEQQSFCNQIVREKKPKILTPPTDYSGCEEQTSPVPMGVRGTAFGLRCYFKNSSDGVHEDL